MARKGLIIGPGIADHPHLTVPDTKFNAKGVYKTGLVLSGEAAQTTKAAIDALVDEAYASDEMKAKLAPEDYKKAVKYYPYEIDEDGEGNPTGFIKFNAKQNATIPLKEKDPKTGKMFKDMKPRIADTDNKTVKKVDIWSGSELNLIVVPRAIVINPPKLPKGMPQPPYQIGIQLALAGVQIVNLKTGGEGAQFRKIEGGFKASEDDDGGDAEAGEAANSESEF